MERHGQAKPSDIPVEYPAAEPEIIPPGAPYHGHGFGGERRFVWIALEGERGARTPWSLIAVLLVFGLLSVTLVLLLLGAFLIWLPIAAGVLGGWLVWNKLRRALGGSGTREVTARRPE